MLFCVCAGPEDLLKLPGNRAGFMNPECPVQYAEDGCDFHRRTNNHQLIGVGEGLEDLVPFDARSFVEALSS